jgi:preprotein translocase subunit SecG
MVASIVLSVHILAALGIIGLVLVQHGKGADMGAAFGSGSAGSLFGSAGASNFLSRSTAVCATVFFITSMALTYFHAPKGSGAGVTGGLTSTAPAAEAPKGADAIPKPASAPVGGEAKPATPAPAQIPK